MIGNRARAAEPRCGRSHPKNEAVSTSLSDKQGAVLTGSRGIASSIAPLPQLPQRATPPVRRVRRRRAGALEPSFSWLRGGNHCPARASREEPLVTFDVCRLTPGEICQALEGGGVSSRSGEVFARSVVRCSALLAPPRRIPTVRGTIRSVCHHCCCSNAMPARTGLPKCRPPISSCELGDG